MISIKNIFSFLIIASLSTYLVYAGPAPEEISDSFTDIDESHENYDAIEFVRESGIVNGYDDGTYQADNEINRAEFTKIVVNSSFDTEVIDACTESEFLDVDVTEWYAKYICVAKNKDIIQGYSDGNFRPEKNISIVEAAKIIVLAQNWTVESGDPWYETYMMKLEENSAIPNSILAFEQEITRGEMAEIIYRIVGEVSDKESTTYNALAGIEEESTDEDQSIDTNEDSTKEFDITAEKWSFSPSTITVNEGDTVILNIESTDVTHGFFIEEFGVDETLTAGETVTVEFIADEKGTYSFFCSVFCGSGHSDMNGTLIVE